MIILIIVSALILVGIASTNGISTSALMILYLIFQGGIIATFAKLKSPEYNHWIALIITVIGLAGLLYCILGKSAKAIESYTLIMLVLYLVTIVLLVLDKDTLKSGRRDFSKPSVKPEPIETFRKKDDISKIIEEEEMKYDYTPPVKELGIKDLATIRKDYNEVPLNKPKKKKLPKRRISKRRKRK